MGPVELVEILEPEGQTDLEKMRHSCAHVMAHAIQVLWPKAKFGIGPTVENGFYYDVDLESKLIPEDLLKIESEMDKIIKTQRPFVRSELPISEAITLFQKLNQPYKIDIIQTLVAQNHATSVSIYEEGGFVDLCRGPHIGHTGEVKSYKLLSIAGAYWRGSEKNPQLQRIYGAAFLKGEELKDFLHFQEEAKKRDHRKLGKDLDLFSFHPESPATPFFHPKGAVVYHRLVQYIRDLYKIYEYEEIITPQIMDVALWKKSGHYDNYRENMYFTQVDEREFAVKPMNCPASTFVYSSQKRSYRDLPLRLADFGRLHRYERSGVTAGLTRVRSFCQDDAHIFCTPDQMEEEIHKTVTMILEVNELFQFTDIKILLATRPERRVGSDELWGKAETALKKVLDALGRPYQVHQGDGAFYGPKIDFLVRDAVMRYHQCGTIQLDFNLPERFQLEFVTTKNSFERPVMIHRAVLGSLERFIGVYLEHVAGVLPFWLAPVQARVIGVKDAHVDYCLSFVNELKKCNFRVQWDGRNESMGLKIREAQVQKIPFTLVAGDKETQNQGFTLRRYGEKEMEMLTRSEIMKRFDSLENYPNLQRQSPGHSFEKCNISHPIES